MLKNLKRNNKGFSIIEVLIVLAIAGVILLVVLMAIPALKRNQNNQAITNDASTVLNTVSEWTQNHNGVPPTQANLVAFKELLKIKSDVTTIKDLKGGGTAARVTDVAVIVVATYAKCKDDNSAERGTARSNVVLFAVEAGRNKPTISRCTDG